MFPGTFTKAFGLFIAVFFIICMTFQTVPIVDEVVISASAISQADQDAMEENITAAIVQWVPFIVVMAFIGTAIGYLGIKLQQ